MLSVGNNSKKGVTEMLRALEFINKVTKNFANSYKMLSLQYICASLDVCFYFILKIVNFIISIWQHCGYFLQFPHFPVLYILVSDFIRDNVSPNLSD